MQPPIFRNSSNSSTRRLQHRYPWHHMILINEREKVSGELLYHLATLVKYRLRNVIRDGTS